MEKKEQFISANKLLDRPSDDAYINEWTALLQKEKSREEGESENSIVIFRLGNEWLAISTKFFTEIAENRKIHSIPHRSGTILLGVVNLRGQLKLCISLHGLLEIEQQPQTENGHSTERMVSIQKEGERWIFPVDDVYGISRFDLNYLENVPVTVAKSTANYLKGVIKWEGKRVGYLDEELLFYSLKRSVL